MFEVWLHSLVTNCQNLARRNGESEEFADMSPTFVCLLSIDYQTVYDQNKVKNIVDQEVMEDVTK